MNVTSHLEEVSTRLERLSPRARLEFSIGCAERFSRFLADASLSAIRLRKPISSCLEHLEFCRTADLALHDTKLLAEERMCALDEFMSDDHSDRPANEEPDPVLEGLVLAVWSCLAEVCQVEGEALTGAAGSVLDAIELALQDDRYACFDNLVEVEAYLQREAADQLQALK